MNCRRREFSRIAAVVNSVVIVCELAALYLCLKAGRGATLMAYYTQLSNMVALVSTVVWFIKPWHRITEILRYLSSCMLTMTFIVVVCVLIPMGASAREMLLTGSMFYHHLLCPILSVESFLLLENKTPLTPHLLKYPLGVTFVYGITMIILNGFNKFTGPYPFFEVNRQGIPVTILWVIVLMLVILGIAQGIRILANRNIKTKK